jgi:hypothetical protein
MEPGRKEREREREREKGREKRRRNKTSIVGEKNRCAAVIAGQR